MGIFMRIGLIVGNLNNDYCDKIINYISCELSTRNIQLIIFECCTLDNIGDGLLCGNLFKLINSQYLDGIIIIPATFNYNNVDVFTKLLDQKINKPIVSMGFAFEDFPSVVLDYTTGFNNLISHLISHDIKDTAYISGPLSNPISALKHISFLEAIEKNQLKISTNLIFEGAGGYMQGYNSARMIIPLVKSKLVQAVICSDNEIAVSVIKCFKENDLIVPNDVAVLGFDDTIPEAKFSPYLTTLVSNLDQIINKTFSVLFESIFGDVKIQKHVLNPSLIIGESCGCDIKRDDKIDYSIPWTKSYGIRLGNSLDHDLFISTLTMHLNTNNIEQCYIVRYTTPIITKVPINSLDKPKATIVYGYNKGNIINYTKSFSIDNILPEHILNNIKSPILITPLFFVRIQFGYLLVSVSESMAYFTDDLSVELCHYFAYHYLSSEQEKLEKKIADAHESLMISNRRLNELTVKGNLDKLDNLRRLASNMLQTRKGSTGKYALIIVEIENFHEINTFYGFSEGEYVLSSVSDILANIIRNNDVLDHQHCERYVLLMKNIQHNPIQTIVNRLTKALDKLNSSIQKPYSITVCWGAATANMENSFDTTYSHAEQNLQDNKKNKRALA